jgi:hypothetical protein
MTQEYDIVGGFISPEAKAELNIYMSQLEQASVLLAKINASSSTSGGGSSTGGSGRSGRASSLSEEAALIEKIAAADKKLRMQQLADYDKLIQKETELKSNRQAANNQQDGYLNQLKKSVADLTLAYMRLDEVEFKNAKNGDAGTVGNDVLTNLKKQRAELDLAQQAYGNYSGQVGHYSTATKMLGINLGQVLKEMPNFAISARIGIMSLTNNLPMLAEAFQAVSKEQKAMILAQKEMTAAQIAALGPAGKIPSMFSLISKSIFGVTGIMSGAMVIMQLYGPAILKWVGTWITALAGTQAYVDKLTISQQALSKVLTAHNGVVQSNAAKVSELGMAIDKYRKGVGSSKAIVDEYNTTLGTHYGKLNNINEVMANYAKNAKNFIDWTIKMQASLLQMDAAAQKMTERQDSQMKFKALGLSEADKKNFSIFLQNTYDLYERTAIFDKEQKLNRELTKKERDATLVDAHNLFAFDMERGKMTKSQNILDITTEEWKYNMQKKQLSIEQTQTAETIKNFTSKGKAAIKYLTDITVKTSQMQSLKASATELYPGQLDKAKDEPTNAQVVQTAQDIYVAQEFYDKKRAELVQLMSDMELRTQKATTDGVLISFKEREQAAQWYFDTAAKLADVDNKKANNDAINRFEKDTKDIEQKKKRNNALFAADKISKAEHDKSDKEYAVASMHIKENFDTDFIQAEDKFNKTLESEALKLSKTLFTISQDRYKEEIDSLKVSNEEKLRLIEENYTKQKAKTASKSTGEIVASAVTGYSKSNTQQQLSDQQSYNDSKIMLEIDTLQKEYDLADTSGARKLEISKRWDELSKERIKTQSQFELQSAIELEKTKEQIQLESATKIADTLTAVWDGFFKRYSDSLDAQLATDKKISDERLSEIQLKEDAGVLSTKDAADEKARIEAMAQGQQDEIDRKKKESDKTKFLVEQGIAIAKIWVNYAMAVSSIENLLVAGALTPLYTGLAVASTALVLAQTIPAFEEGGVVEKDGKVLVGEKRHELWVSPNGYMGVTPNTPTVMNMEAGTKIYPDLTKIDLMSIIGLSKISDKSYDMYRVENVLRNIEKGLANQKSTKLSTQRLFDQLNQSDKYLARKKGLMN